MTNALGIAPVAALCGLIVVLMASAGAGGGEKLYNGIVLPDRWPPKIKANTREPMPVPYLKRPPAVIPIDVGRQLFVDDFLIERAEGLERTFYSLEPYQGNPVLTPGLPGGRKDPNLTYAMAFSGGVWYDPKDKLYKMWYYRSAPVCTAYAYSRDGIRWIKPRLDIVPGTNVVHKGHRDANTIWLDHNETNPKRRFKMFRFPKKPRRGLVLHYSPDGIHWSRQIQWAGKCHDRTTAFYNPFRKVWVISAKGAIFHGGGKYTRVRRYSEGPTPVAAMRWDGYEDNAFWVRSDKLDPVNPDPKISTVPQLYNLDCAPYESLMLGLFVIWQGPPNVEVRKRERPKRNEVFLGFSRDGFHWDRPYRKRFVGVSEKRGDWNWGNVQSVGGGCLVVGDKLYFYYSGRGRRGKLDKASTLKVPGACTGLGFLRRDGFASMDAATCGGVLTTRPVTFRGKHLFVNVAAAEGELRVEVLDKAGRVIEPFSRDACDPIRADKTLQAVVWRGTDDFERDLSSVAGRQVRFRFHLKNGRLFSFWVSPEAGGASHGYVAAGGPGFTGPKDTIGAAAYPK